MAFKRPNKSAFIRQHASAKAADIVALGKKAGLRFSVSYVHSIRGAAKRASKAGRIPGKAGRPQPTKRAPSAGHDAAHRAVWNVIYMFGVDTVKANVSRIERELAAKTRR
jgi:hypothetical protein